ncbi:hypothetical protein CVT24_002197 [Panaeolus cyanescens]|uniref:Uncharacterized protein n=1 Tax=Panaeolus cyanescens TaxID=181874 RepID=A0A409YI05_9AGAR|nr:hypothetical protein CVT24_002197 [Panaeolus cyanescens]
MSIKLNFVCLALSLFAASQQAFAREAIWERDDRAVYLHPRRFGQENPAVIQKLSAACPGQVCGTLAGAAITPLLAAQPECSQQDMADDIIDASRQFDEATQRNMIAIAIEYRQAEKNTPPDFSTNPPSLRNSVFCQKAPRNAELNGLVQAQDPANDPDLFFDPALKATVRRGTQANTAPFQGGGAQAPAPPAPPAEDPAAPPAATPTDCPSVVTVTVPAGAAAPTAAPPATGNTGNAGNAGNIGDFGSCSVPEIEFAAGFDNRRETSFRPVDPTSFTQGSAQNINIITRAMCDQLVNTCGADQTARATCARAQTAAAAAPVGSGAQADAFNAVFGINTNFVNVQQIDNQGRPVGAAQQAPAQPAPAPANGNNNAGNAGAGGNLQGFTGNLGGVVAPTVTALGNGQFQVANNAAFNNLRNAVVRSCDVQNNQCANAANASGNRNGFNVAACNAQQAQCIAQAGN